MPFMLTLNNENGVVMNLDISHESWCRMPCLAGNRPVQAASPATYSFQIIRYPGSLVTQVDNNVHGDIDGSHQYDLKGTTSISTSLGVLDIWNSKSGAFCWQVRSERC